MTPAEEKMLAVLKAMGQAVCDHVWKAVSNQQAQQLSAVYKQGEDDTIYQIDRDVEELLLPLLEASAAELGGIAVIGEGIGEDPSAPLILPTSIAEQDAAWRLILDPIDGTRGIMYDKRSAFFLAGAAPNKGTATKLSEITVAVMAELPTSKAYLANTLWAIKGNGANASQRNLLTGDVKALPLQPSKATTIIGGFAQLARFFPPGREVLARMEDKLILELIGDAVPGRAYIFEDQYISTGGQLYEVLMGHDRFVGDVRSRLYPKLAREGVTPGHVCHPYDACTFLIGLEAGCVITDPWGQNFDAPMDVLSNVGFLLFANDHIFNQVAHRLQQLMTEEGL